MHTLLEIDGIEYLDTIPLFQKSISAFHHNGAFRVSDNIGTVALEQVRFQPESGLAGTGTAHNQHILIPGILGVGRTIGHHQPLCLRQNNIVLKLRCHEWGNVLGIAP